MDAVSRSEMQPRAISIATWISLLFICGVAMATALVASHDALARRIDKLSIPQPRTPAALDTTWEASRAQSHLDTAPRSNESDDAWVDRHYSTYRAAREKSEQ